MQVFPAVQRHRLCLIGREVFVHVLVETQDDAAEIHFIQLAELLVAQAIAFAVVRLGGFARSLVDVPAAQRRVGGDDL
ncbi:hypothetical protein D3C76_1642540 [compost metagenome]